MSEANEVEQPVPEARKMSRRPVLVKRRWAQGDDKLARRFEMALSDEQRTALFRLAASWNVDAASIVRAAVSLIVAGRVVFSPLAVVALNRPDVPVEGVLSKLARVDASKNTMSVEI